MSKALYLLALKLYLLGIYLLSFTGNKKAKRWLKGRRHIWPQLQALPKGQPRVWIHCASLGEYEQARPLIDALDREMPGYIVCLTFFSPSGYEQVAKRGTHKQVFYLPLDSPANARRFLDAVQPSLAIMVKYEHWYYYLTALQQRQIPVILVSAIFRPAQAFFQWYGGLFREMLHTYRHIFVQNEASVELLETLGISKVTVSGDTRFDRVWEIYSRNEDLPQIATFGEGKRLIIAGSTWQQDEVLLTTFINEKSAEYPDVRFVIVPHEVSEASIADLIRKLKVPYSLYSKPSGGDAPVMIVDAIGLLSRIYRYGHITYIGGGFGAGIHNTLEAAVHGLPVVFGPHYRKFLEALELKDAGAAFSVDDYFALEKTFSKLLKEPLHRHQSGLAAHKYVLEKRGATGLVLQYIENLLPKRHSL